MFTFSTFITMYFIILPFLFLAACSDGLTYNKGTEPITIDLLIASDTVTVGDSVKFRVDINPSREYAKRVYWYLNSQKFERWYIDTAFSKSGVYNATFHLVDNLYDTLSSQQVTITVAHKPECNNICYDFYSNTFKWECSEKDNDDLTYHFSYTDDNYPSPIKRDYLTTNSWRPDIPNLIIPSDGWSVNVIAENSFKIQSETISGNQLCP